MPEVGAAAAGLEKWVAGARRVYPHGQLGGTAQERARRLFEGWEDRVEPGTEPLGTSGPDWGAAMALMAHGLLTPVAVVRGFAETLLHHWDKIEPENRELYLTRIIDNADFVTESLHDLTRGLPPGTSQLLAELDAESAKRYLTEEGLTGE